MSGVVWVAGGPKPEEVMRDTWGHMDARPGVRYRGTIVFAEGAFGGELMILHSEFGNAGYGPWFYEGIQAWLCEQKTEPGRIYRFEGTYKLGRGGSHDFEGDVSSIALPGAMS